MSDENKLFPETQFNNRNIIVLTTLSCFVLFFICPLLVWIFMKDKFNSNEKSFLTDLLNFELTLFVICIIIFSVNIIPFFGKIIFGFGSLILFFTNLIVILKALLKITNNESYKFPFTINLLQ